MIKANNIDLLIAESYAKQVLDPVKYGESGVFFWFPGCGMTTIENDIFSNKSVLKSQLQGLTLRLKTWQMWGHVAEEKNAIGWLRTAFNSESELREECKRVLEKGLEMVLVVGKIDDFENEEKIKVLQILLRTQEINKRRVHIILNLTDKPWWEMVVVAHPEFIALANRSEIIGCLPDNLLNKYILENSLKFDCPLNLEKTEILKKNYGGVLKLVKEYLRSGGEESGIEIKLGVIWRSLPIVYQETIREMVVGKRKVAKTKTEKDLEKFGVWNLDGFKKHYSVLITDPEEVLSKILTDQEKKLWNILKKQTGMLIKKDEVVEILRPDELENVSLWAIDQAISRFKKKLKYSGMDVDQLITKKGLGYIWTG